MSKKKKGELLDPESIKRAYDAMVREKWTPEGFLVSARDHVGRIMDNTKITELLDSLVYVGVGYFGARAAQNISGSQDPETLLGGALTGIVGYKLATTMGGTPPVSQIAGLAILAAIGVTDLNLFKAAADTLTSDPVVQYAEQLIKDAEKQHQDRITVACKKCTDDGGKCTRPGEDGLGGRSPYVKCTYPDGTEKFIRW